MKDDSNELDNLKVKEALPILYKNYQLESDGGVNDASVEIRLLKGVTLYIPNIKTRRKVVKKHDIHHLVTGYSAVMKGETEISAWELSTGCRHNWFAFFINTLGMMSGIPFNLRGIWKAWARGRRTTNVYGTSHELEELLNQTVGDLKKELGLLNEDKAPGYSIMDFLSFVLFLIFGTVLSIASFVLIPFVLLYSLFIYIQKRT